jgi:hypothetical protein
MLCPACASGHQAEFTAEVNLHVGGLKYIDDPGVLMFPKLLVCLDCGFARFVAEKTELERLASSTSATATSTRNGTPPRPPSAAGECA